MRPTDLSLWRTITHEELMGMVTPEPNTGCWLLPFGKDDHYSQVSVDGFRGGAHRYMLDWSMGWTLGDKWALHKCNFKPCCNPDHLYAGTCSDNARDAWRNPVSRERIAEANRMWWANPENYAERMAYMAKVKKWNRAKARSSDA